MSERSELARAAGSGKPSSRVALVTGCSSGIGLATAVEFARQGCAVVAAMRNLDRAGPLRQALHDARVEADVRVLDVADDESVRSAVASITADHGGIDIVISNAGVGIDGTTEELTIEDFRVSFETNVLGSVRLLQALLPAWRRRGSGRFVAVSSMAGILGTPLNDAYCTSKFGLEGLLESLHPVAAQHGVQISIVEPGPVSGDFAHKHGPPVSRTEDGPYAAARAAFQRVQDGGYDTAQTSEEIAAVLWQVACADEPVLRYQTSDDVAKIVGLKVKDVTGERVTGLTARWIR
ncbi:MAG: SDR family oxidoreductase [Acidimicrobiia bacterium]